MLRQPIRMKAAQDIAEALSLGVQQPPAPVGPPPPALAPQGPPVPGMAQGALQGGAPPGMPQQRPGMSPLQQMPTSFRSAPMQAALQGAEGMKGHPAMNKPTGFAEGGFVVRR